MPPYFIIMTKNIPAYSKVEHKLLSLIDDCNLSLHARGVLLTLILNIRQYGNLSIISHNDLCYSARCSKSTLSKAIKELRRANIMTVSTIKGKTNYYELNYAFMGHKEVTEEVQQNTSNEVLQKPQTDSACTQRVPLYTYNINKNNKATTHTGDRILKFSQKERLQIEQYVDLLQKTGKINLDSVGKKFYVEKTLHNVYRNNEWQNIENKIKKLKDSLDPRNKDNLDFKPNSFFLTIRKSRWKAWIKCFGFDYVQSILRYLDHYTKSIKTSAESLMYSGLVNGSNWEKERACLDKAKKFEAEWEVEKKRMNSDLCTAISNLVEDEDDELDPEYEDFFNELLSEPKNSFDEEYECALCDISIVTNAKELLLLDPEFQSLETMHPRYKLAFKRKVVELYRKNRVAF